MFYEIAKGLKIAKAIMIISLCVLTCMPFGYTQRRIDESVQDLKDEDWAVRESAVDKLVGIGRASVNSLIAALKDEDPNVRAGAAKALGRIKDRRAVQPLINTLRDGASEVRWEAVHALLKIGERPVDPLIDALNDQDSGIRADASCFLGFIANSLAVEPLIDALEDEDLRVRWSAISALAMIGGARAEGALNLLSKDINLLDVALDHESYIEKGEKGTEALLILALLRYGSKGMMVNFRYCGNSLLEEAARIWMKSHGIEGVVTDESRRSFIMKDIYGTITVISLPQYPGGVPQWGSER